jgi:ATP/maltotriose-dependent transcriptional regulator MalT
MTMSFLLHDSPGEIETSELRDPVPRMRRLRRGAAGRLAILGEKLRIPDTGAVVERQRLTELLSRSTTNFAATLISGRAGTGKTYVAAGFAAQQGNAVWYSVEPADSSWPVFSQYFLALLLGPDAVKRGVPGAGRAGSPSETAIAKFLASAFRRLQRERSGRPMLIALDDIHHLFDAEWFAAFFLQLIASLPTETHLLMTCRSKPPAPLWRLRSKQILNVIDEGIIDFSPDEVRQLFEIHDVPPELAAEARRRSPGRVARLVETLDEMGKGAR